jgi:hypothetical protein
MFLGNKALPVCKADPTAIYSAYNHKRATAAKCPESHHRRTDATTAVPFPDSESVTHGILQWWRAYDCTHCISRLSR